MDKKHKSRLAIAGAGVGVALAFVGLFFSTGIFSGSSKPDSNCLVVYASERPEMMEAVIPLFEEKYHIQVHLVVGESKELLQRLRNEKKGERADVIMGLSQTELAGSQELFQDYVSVNDKYILEPCRNAEGYATSYVLNGSCLIVNKTLAGDKKISSYEDLLNPALKGRIIMADPASSSTGFSQLVNLLEAKGGCGSPEAWEFAEELLKQTGCIASSSREVYTSVAKGEYIVGLSHEDACAGLMREGADVRIVYPKEGSLYSPRVAAISGNAEHTEYAKYFLDFITGKDMQDIFGTLLTSRPVRQDAKTSQFLKDMDHIPVITENQEYLRLHKDELQKRFSEIQIEK